MLDIAPFATHREAPRSLATSGSCRSLPEEARSVSRLHGGGPRRSPSRPAVVLPLKLVAACELPGRAHEPQVSGSEVWLYAWVALRPPRLPWRVGRKEASDVRR